MPSSANVIHLTPFSKITTLINLNLNNMCILSSQLQLFQGKWFSDRLLKIFLSVKTYPPPPPIVVHLTFPPKITILVNCNSSIWGSWFKQTRIYNTWVYFNISFNFSNQTVCETLFVLFLGFFLIPTNLNLSFWNRAKPFILTTQFLITQ